jgi:hypothetical protein
LYVRLKNSKWAPPVSEAIKVFSEFLGEKKKVKQDADSGSGEYG